MIQDIIDIWNEQSRATKIALLNIHLVVALATTIALFR